MSEKKINNHSTNFQEVNEFEINEYFTNPKAISTLCCVCLYPIQVRTSSVSFILLGLFPVTQRKRSHRSTSLQEEKTCISLITNLNFESTNISRASASSLAFDIQQKIYRRKWFVSNYALETNLSSSFIFFLLSFLRNFTIM